MILGQLNVHKCFVIKFSKYMSQKIHNPRIFNLLTFSLTIEKHIYTVYTDIC
jgi:hypothetical protein